MTTVHSPIRPYGLASEAACGEEPAGYLEGVRLASAGWRLASTAIDLLVTVFVPLFAITLLKNHPNLVPVVGRWLAEGLGKDCLDEACSAYYEHASVWPVAIVSWAVIANSVVMQGRTGQSFGKRFLSDLAEPHPYDPDMGQPPDPLRWFRRPGFEMRLARAVHVPGQGSVLVYPGVAVCLVRLLGHVLDCFFFIGFLRLAWHPWRQTFADERIRTVVIGERRQLYAAEGRSIL